MNVLDTLHDICERYSILINKLNEKGIYEIDNKRLIDCHIKELESKLRENDYEKN